uniref:Polo_box_2 domain-containing protein n=1 Tax=Caenorhabditis japonica TaxID=281687 RepID=A0A8R1E817_CAEJA
MMTDFMRENTDDEARLYSRESSRDGRRRSREPRYPSRDGRSQDRRPPLRSSSQPVNSARMPLPSSQTNRPVHDRLPSTSTRPMPTTVHSGERDRHHNDMWPIRMERLAGQRIRTQGGRYVAELNTRCRFEVATRGDITTRILITEYDPYRRIQTVFVHRIADRRERGREEGDDLIELTRNPMVYTAEFSAFHTEYNKTNNRKAAVDQLEDVEMEDNFQDCDQEDYYHSDTSIDVRNDA